MATDGHSINTAVPVFMARVRTERGELVRIYEYARDPDIANLTYQVDVWLPANGTAAYVHVRLNNTGDRELSCYWWTNIAHTSSDVTRVLYPGSKAIIKQTYLGPFPFFDNDASTNVTFRPDDMSFPRDFWDAAETYPLLDEKLVGDTVNANASTSRAKPSLTAAPHATTANTETTAAEDVRAWMSTVDGATGSGLAHVGNVTEQPGRKYWVWGMAPDNDAREMFLSSPGRGRCVALRCVALRICFYVVVMCARPRAHLAALVVLRMLPSLSSTQLACARCSVHSCQSTPTVAKNVCVRGGGGYTATAH
jgi:hypothetical protein